MSTLYFEMFYLFAKIFNNTNKNIAIVIVAVILLSLTVIFRISVKSGLLDDNISAGLFLLLLFGSLMVIVIGTYKGYPKDIKVTSHAGQYREIETKNYKIDDYVADKRTTLTSKKVINYRLVDKEQNELYVYKKTKKYEDEPGLSKYPDKYHKKTLIKVFMRPVKVTTDWRGIKESYDLYEVKEVYKVEPDVAKFEDDQIFQK